MSLKAILLWTLAAALLILGIALYRLRLSERQLQVDPHAREEIEKAKER
jgi:hypothetical protein